MKKILFSLLLFFSFHISSSQEISLPEPVVDSILLDLAELDKRRQEAIKTDSIFTVYELELKRRTDDLRNAIITVDEYKVFVEKLVEKGQIRDEKLRETRKIINRLKLLHVLRTVGEVAVIVLIIAL